MAGGQPRATHYCPSCGERVFTYSAGVHDRTEIRCGYCGLPLELAESVQAAPGGCVVVVDDDRFFLTLLTDLLTKEGLAAEVLRCDSGASFLTQLTQRFRQEQPVRLAILDIVMSPLDGVAAALALRALERGFDRGVAIPILFFSAAKATEALRTAMAGCAPAYYLNKGSDATPERLAARMRELFGHVFGGAAEPRRSA
ncbi:MAG: response regulator [candidate division NC10 bacterium]|nr:response regulator [candidate division NC10 bacterium]